MKILLTGATGYIGKRLLPVLLEAGHEIIACVRNPNSFEQPKNRKDQIELFQVDFLEPVLMEEAPTDFDVAYYLIHSMSNSISDFQELEAKAAQNFRHFIEKTRARQIIYLTGIVNEDKLSKHLASRLEVEKILAQASVPLTAIRAGIIIGSGSASFEIIRDLVEKLPIMVAPRWLNTRCQPIAIRNVVEILTKVLLREDTYHNSFDIGSEEILTYLEMLMGYARVRKLNRLIITLPVMTPRLSSYWLYFVTATTYPLAVNLVNSMKVDVVVRDNSLAERLDIDLIPYKQAVQLAFRKIEQNLIISSWKDALISSSDQSSLQEYAQVPTHGCFIDRKAVPLQNNSAQQVWANIQAIGGERGWYYGNWLWKIRGYLDKLVGGIGLRRGRTHPTKIKEGDALDFWRVLIADDEERRLLLYAEMKLPGEAWLEFKIKVEKERPVLYQTATFRPYGIIGRLYWYAIVPLHYFVFNGMVRKLEAYSPSN
jgi:uncharacterized protein YbjT (DUF2867 family)